MKTSRQFLRGLVLIGEMIVVVLLPLRASAQGGPTKQSAALQAMADQRTKSFDDAFPLFVAGKAGVAEQTLCSAIREKNGTAAYHVIAGQRLYAMAVSLRSRGYESAAKDAIARALEELDQAANLGRAKSDAAAQVAAHQQAGAICEFFLRDSSGAVSHYAEAQRANPNARNVARDLDRARQADRQINRAPPQK